MSRTYRFEGFALDADERRLTRGSDIVELNGRYFDALLLLVREPGRLVSKDRFMDEVWRGVPVTDEALTQCIRTLRRQLGDDAGNPRFIETVPKHGYRFVAPVADASDPKAPAPDGEQGLTAWQQFLLLGAAGAIGGAVAGLVGGLIYGVAGASQPVEPGPGAISVLLVVWSASVFVAAVGGAGVAFGIAAARALSGRSWGWAWLGGGLGGLFVGTSVKLLGLDAFTLLLGRSAAA